MSGARGRFRAPAAAPPIAAAGPDDRGAAVPVHRSAQRRRAGRRHPGRRGSRAGRARAARPSSTPRAGAGIRLRELGGGWTLASDPAAEDAARRLFSRPRASTLTPPRPRRSRSSPTCSPCRARRSPASAASAPTRRPPRCSTAGLIEEAGHSQFGAVLYRTSTQFLKLFGLRTLEELPDVARWDPTPEEQAELRERLLRAGEARAGDGPRGPLAGLRAASWPQAASMSRPRVRRTVAGMPRDSSAARKARDRLARSSPRYGPAAVGL